MTTKFLWQICNLAQLYLVDEGSLALRVRGCLPGEWTWVEAPLAPFASVEGLQKCAGNIATNMSDCKGKGLEDDLRRHEVALDMIFAELGRRLENVELGKKLA